MKTEDENKMTCIKSGKICYSEREAGIIINGCKKHIYIRHGIPVKSSHGNSKAIPRRKYICPDCGFYHVTHQPKFTHDDRSYDWEERFYREVEGRRRRKSA